MIFTIESVAFWVASDIDVPNLDTEIISDFVDNKVPNDVFFNIPYISTEQVHSYRLECSKVIRCGWYWA